MSTAPLIAPQSLPIDNVLPELVKALQSQNKALLVAQPGAGKTTRVPLALLDAFPAKAGRWLLLEPRRVAARLAAGFMAQSLGESLGETVGYRVRGESKISSRTRLEVVTQGILTRMLQDDPSLEGFAGIIFDEFHERSLDGDLGLAFALEAQSALREDLRILIMSATLDTVSLLTMLGDQTPLINCAGRAWPVETYYRSAAPREFSDRHQATVISEALLDHEGDVLVFLPGQGEIRRLHSRLNETLASDITIVDLHGQLPLAQQQDVLRSHEADERRVILSTAIAESSITVPGVRIVVDAGLERVPVFQVRSGLSKLETRRVNRASADQRRGRAGREAAGACYRLWPEDSVLAAHREAEIEQADLSILAFELTRWGAEDPLQLAWVSPPPAAAFTAGRQLLQTLGLLGTNGGFSALGRRCARWPTHPRLAVLIEKAIELNAQALACWIVSWLEESVQGTEIDIAIALSQHPQSNGKGAGGAWWRAAKQWASRLKCGLDSADVDLLPLLLASAYPDRIAQNQGQENEHSQARFKLVSGGQALIASQHRLSQQAYLLAVNLDGMSKGAKVYHACAITKAQIESLLPNTRQWQQDVRWDTNAGRLQGEEQRRLGTLVLERRALAKLAPEAIQLALLTALRQRGAFNWSKEDQQLIGRLRLLHRQLGDPWPDASDEALLDKLEDWLAPHLTGLTRFEQLDRLPLARFVVESLDWKQQQALSKLTPTHIQVPSGNKIALDYIGEEPVLAVKLQEMFGQTNTPGILDGQVPVLLHLLSPARRPVQVTRDLAGFWKSGYFEVRKDLKGRYPRHPWPDDPLQAQATARAKKKGT